MSDERFELTSEYISQILEDQEIYSMIMDSTIHEEEEILRHKKLGTLDKLEDLIQTIEYIISTDEFLYMEDHVMSNHNSDMMYEFGIRIHNLNGIFYGEQVGDLGNPSTLFSDDENVLYEELSKY